MEKTNKIPIFLNYFFILLMLLIFYAVHWLDWGRNLIKREMER